MGLLKLAIRPGIVLDETQTLSEGRYVDGNHVRFLDGLPQPIGGWKLYDLDGASFWGKCRKLREWVDLDGVKYVALGTHRRLYVATGGSLYNITPIRESGSLGANPVATVSGQSIVTITDASHGLEVGAVAILAGLAAANGITANGTFVVLSTPTAGTYTIETGTAASGTGSGGGAGGTYQYEINPGAESGSFGLGYGTGPYGEGTWGTPRTASGVKLAARTWTIDTFGEIPLFCHRPSGSIYEWDLNTANRATLTTNAPTNNVGIIVTGERIVVALGASGDKLLVKWSDQEDRTSWTPAATNQAGDYLLSGGNEIIGAEHARGGTQIICTDTDAFAMQYRGDQFVFGFQRLGEQCGLIGPNAIVEVAGLVYWMSLDDFYVFDGGGVRLLPSTDLHDFLFGTINKIQRDKVFAGYNARFQEIWWWYVSSASDEVDRYVAVSVIDGSWTVGTMERTAWMTGDLIGTPLAAHPRGVLLQHEDGRNDYDPFVAADPIFTVNGSNLVVILLEDHGGQPGDTIIIQNCDSLGGVEIEGTHEIYSVPDFDRIVIENTNGAATGDAGPGGGDEVLIAIRKPIAVSIETGDMDMGDGDDYMDVLGFIPDFNNLSGTLDLYLLTREYPTSTRESELVQIAPTDGRLDTRSSGRQLALRFEQNEIDGFWRIGAHRIDIQPAGRRR